MMHGEMVSRDGGSEWPIAQARVRPPYNEGGSFGGDRVEPTSDSQPLQAVLLSWLSELRRRWWLASIAVLLVFVPVAAYGVFAVPTYTSVGVVQVSSQDASISPLLGLVGAPASEVETEVEIIRGRELVLRVLKQLRLHLADPHQSRRLTTDFDVVLGRASAVRPMLRIARDAVDELDVSPGWHDLVSLEVSGLPQERLSIRVGTPEATREYEAGLGDTVVDDVITLRFRTMPVPEGETLELEVLSDGILIETLAKRLSVSSVGDSRTATNLVEIEFTDSDRETAQAVVQTLMQEYLDQSLRWQSISASSSSDFIGQRLEEAREQLTARENTLREFAEAEHAVQLDVQAEVTIRGAAELEAEKRKIELQEQVIGSIASGLKRAVADSGHASLTASFFDDPVLASAVGSLTESELQYAVLRATLTDDHPRVVILGRQIAHHQAEIRGLLRSAQRNLAQQRKELDVRIAGSMDSLSNYPAKELQLARHMRDVEVNQKLYLFLLEKHQEAQILEVSTTIDKRIVDGAALPHRKTSPRLAKLVVTGLLASLAFMFIIVYLAHALQRRLQTVEAIKKAIPFPIYGSVPVIGPKTANQRRKAGASRDLGPSVVWDQSAGSAAESFRALAVNISLAPAVSGHGRIVQITSSQPGEGKSTVASNVAVALASSGARVLLVDLDLRKPVQHRTWGLRREPGYGDLVAQRGGPAQVLALLQHDSTHNLDIVTAGPKLPDPLSALMGPTLEGVLTYWAERYDYVIIDSPPIFVAGTAVIGRHADLVVVVARPSVTERAGSRHALELLSRIDVHKALVLNGIEPKHTESYYYYGNGNGYE
jgi:tyrosine-protein kinase Etk/Wzc